MANWSYQRVGVVPAQAAADPTDPLIDPSGNSTDTPITSIVSSDPALLVSPAAQNNTSPLSLSQQYRYDIDGNMIYKSNMGDMTYNSKNQLTSSGADTGYTYDANGNMLIGNGKKYDYNEFNKVSKLSYNGNNEEFTYDESDNLVKKVTNGDVITYYGDAGFELTITKKPIGVDDEINMKHTITIEGRTVAIHERTIQGDDKQLDKTAYVHSDAQGSVSLVTDNSRAISFRNEYTPFGESIENLSGNGSFDKQQERGYTGHRMIASANVINMNARIYDPAIARFTSPDTVVPDTTMSMAHNRYIYVYNNPIKYVDPDGHFVWWIFALGAAIFTIGATSDDSFIHSVGTVVGSLMMFYGAALANTSAVGLDAFVEGAKNLSMGQMIVGGSSAGGASSFIASGGDIGETFRGAFLGGVGAAVSYGIGHGGWFSGSKEAVFAQQALAHGVSQGIISELRGGEFKSGFIGGFLGKMTGGLAETMFDDKVAQYIAVTMIGGAVSEAAGGDFLDGAISAAMVHLFNDKVGSSKLKAERGRHLNKYEREIAEHYNIPKVDINNAIIHDGYVPWWLSDDKAGITLWNDIYLREGTYDPNTPAGMSLLVHELKHIGQYREGYLNPLSYGLSTAIHGYRGSPFEDIAYRVSDAVYNDLKNKGYNNYHQILNGSLWK